MPCPCDVLGCCRSCLYSVSGPAVAYYGGKKKNRSAGCRMAFYSPMAVKGGDGVFQCQTSYFMAGDLNGSKGVLAFQTGFSLKLSIFLAQNMHCVISGMVFQQSTLTYYLLLVFL